MEDALIFPSDFENKKESVIASDERHYFSQIESAAAYVVKKNVRFVFLAGPSCSGKTTTAFTLAKDLEQYGKRVASFSTDDFFFDQSMAKRNADGIPDYDAFSHTDSRLLIECLSLLCQEKEAHIPVFDFKKGIRTEKKRCLSPKDTDIFIVEGIHGLNDAILSQMKLPYVGLYLTVTRGIQTEDGAVSLLPEEIRFFRRLIRDFKHRSSEAETTFRLWREVLRSEKEILLPYWKNATLTLNSNFRYEIAVEKEEILFLLKKIQTDSYFYTEARHLMKKIAFFPTAEEELVPQTSVLQEFIQ